MIADSLRDSVVRVFLGITLTGDVAVHVVLSSSASSVIVHAISALGLLYKWSILIGCLGLVGSLASFLATSVCIALVVAAALIPGALSSFYAPWSVCLSFMKWHAAYLPLACCECGPRTREPQHQPLQSLLRPWRAPQRATGGTLF